MEDNTVYVLKVISSYYDGDEILSDVFLYKNLDHAKEEYSKVIEEFVEGKKVKIDYVDEGITVLVDDEGNKHIVDLVECWLIE